MSREQMNSQEHREKQPKYSTEFNTKFLCFTSVKVTERDDTLPTKPAKTVEVTKNDGTVERNVPADTPFCTIKDSKGTVVITVTIADAEHIDALHIRGTEAGSKFSYQSLEDLFNAVANKLPDNITNEPGVSAFAIDTGENTGKEGVASLAELKNEGILAEADLNTVNSVHDEVIELNKSGDIGTKQTFIEEFKTNNPSCKVQFQLVRGTVLIPTVATAKRNTTEIFIVIDNKQNGTRIVKTMAPGRLMPRHPDPADHTSKQGNLNETTLQESAEAWFNTVMLTEE